MWKGIDLPEHYMIWHRVSFFTTYPRLEKRREEFDTCIPLKHLSKVKYKQPHPMQWLFGLVWFGFIIFTQPLRSGRIWHKVNFLSGV